MRSTIDAGTQRTVDVRSCGLVNSTGNTSPARHSSSLHSGTRCSIWFRAQKSSINRCSGAYSDRKVIPFPTTYAVTIPTSRRASGFSRHASRASSISRHSSPHPLSATPCAWAIGAKPSCGRPGGTRVTAASQVTTRCISVIALPQLLSNLLHHSTDVTLATPVYTCIKNRANIAQTIDKLAGIDWIVT